MISEAIVLAGGLGTRLRSAVPDLPKCMAPVAGEPFLAHVIRYYQHQGIKRFIFSLGYMHETIEQYLHEKHASLNYACFIEKEPLGTGGAILASSSLALQKNVIVLNGDTLFAVDLHELSSFHSTHDSDCTLSLKTMYNSDRYGIVEINADGRVTSFREKQFYPQANINGGVYALNLTAFQTMSFGEVFSFEKDYLEKSFKSGKIFALIQDGYFIDIGIPEDYNRAQLELKTE